MTRTGQIAPDNEQLVIIRTLKAPRALVFKAWTDAAMLAQWWGPKGAHVTVNHLDARPGGRFHFSMSSPFGEMWGLFRYLEVQAPERLIYLSSFSDAAGAVQPAPAAMITNFPLEVHNTVTFVEESGRTTLTLKGGPWNASEDARRVYLGLHASMQGGFSGTFEQLERLLSTQL